MFFIVVLLVIAFSTIIGYRPFHYKDHLPKLLLMAVLINFSRTLVGVMIDFSQVITLTFVNGFKQAILGNFQKAFGISGLLDAAKNATGTADVGKLFIASIFAITILTIACTTVLILALYFMARIINLWVLLILSPIAFFATALPGKMQAALSGLSGQWWSQLSTWLTGGPIVAFFLWLSLAVVQQGTNEFVKFHPDKTPDQLTQYDITVTDIGKPDNIGLLIISVALMLTGVKIAVETSQKASGVLGDTAKKIRDRGINMPARWVGRQTKRAATAPARGAVRLMTPVVGAYAGKKATDWDALAGRAGRVPLIGGILAGAAVQASGKAKTFKKSIDKAADKRTEAMFAGHNAEDKLQHQQTLTRARGGMLYDTQQAIIRDRAKSAASNGGATAIKLEEKRIEDGLKAGGMTQAQIDAPARKDETKVLAAIAGKNDARDIIAIAMESAKKNGDTELADKLKESLKKNITLMKGMGDLEGEINNKNLKATTLDEVKDGRYNAGVLKRFDLANDHGLTKSEAEVLDHSEIKKLLSKGGDIEKLFRSYVRASTTVDGAARLGATVGEFENKAKESANPTHAMLSGDSKTILTAQQAKAPDEKTPRPAATMLPPVMNVADLTNTPRTVNSVADLVASLPAPLQAQAQTDITNAGLDHNAFDDRPMDVAQAGALHNMASMYAAPPPAVRYSTTELAQIKAAHIAGVPSTLALNFDASTHAFKSTQSKDAAEALMKSTMRTGVISANPIDQTRNIKFMADASKEVKAAGEMMDVFVNSLLGNTANVEPMLAQAGEGQEKQVRSALNVVYHEVEAVKRKGVATTPRDIALIQLDNQMGAKKLRILAGEGKKK